MCGVSDDEASLAAVICIYELNISFHVIITLEKDEKTLPGV